MAARAARACWAVSSGEQRLAKSCQLSEQKHQTGQQASNERQQHKASQSERRAPPGSPTDQLRHPQAPMGAGASAETKITKSDALMAVHEAFHGKGDGELSIQEIVSAAPAPTPKTAPASSQDWSAMLRAPPDPSVAARYAAEHRKAVDVPKRLQLALQDEGAMFRLCTHFQRKEDKNSDGGLTMDEFTHLFNQIDPDAPNEIIQEMFTLADTNQMGSVDTWEVMPIMHRMINHALHTRITEELRKAVVEIYEADINVTASLPSNNDGDLAGSLSKFA